MGKKDEKKGKNEENLRGKKEILGVKWGCREEIEEKKGKIEKI